MKLTKLLLITILSTTIFACSSDDDNGSADSVVGTWKLTAINTETAFDLNMDGTASTSFMEETNCYQNETLVFNADGTGVSNSTSYAEIDVEIVIGTTDEYNFTVLCEDDIFSYDFSWVQNGSQLSTTDDDNDTSNINVSGSQITFVLPEGFVAYNSENFDVEITEDLTFVFTKQ